MKSRASSSEIGSWAVFYFEHTAKDLNPSSPPLCALLEGGAVTYVQALPSNSIVATDRTVSRSLRVSRSSGNPNHSERIIGVSVMGRFLNTEKLDPI